MRYAFHLSIALILSVVMCSCRSAKQTSSTASTNAVEKQETFTEPQLLASINRTACFGQCPMYKATFFDNGELRYVGKRFVENIGTYKALISAEQVEEIKTKIKEFEYYSLDSLYPTPITDFPSCITEVNLEGNYKRVVNRLDAPRNLKAFEKYLDGLLAGRPLEKISDETMYDPEKGY